MNVREVYNAIISGKREQQEQAQLEMVSMVQTLSTAVLELAGDIELKTGKDPLRRRTRMQLSEFLELKR